METVFCVIVTYNGMQWIERCLNSLQNSILSMNTIVIDNGSKDSTVSFIKDNYPAVQLIETGKNKGFGQGNNIGLKIALEKNADHIFLLNQDAYIEPDTVSKLVQAQINNPEFGVLSPIHLNGKGDGFDDHFFEYLVKSEIKDLMISLVLNGGNTPSIINTPFVNAAAWLISKDCLKKTGGFDPIFFHYGEDDNYAQRVLYHGFKIGILSTTKVYHDKDRPETVIKPDLQKKIKRDWIFFLNQPCNISNNQYILLMTKRLGRYSLLTGLSLLKANKEEVIYNFTMAKKIAGSFRSVRRSRKISMDQRIIPHL